MSEEGLAEIEERLETVIRLLRKSQEEFAETLCWYALIIAQVIWYCGQEFRLGGSLNQAVKAFLSVDPANPVVEKLKSVINGLLACYSDFRVEPITDSNGIECWRIFQL